MEKLVNHGLEELPAAFAALVPAGLHEHGPAARFRRPATNDGPDFAESLLIEDVQVPHPRHFRPIRPGPRGVDVVGDEYLLRRIGRLLHEVIDPACSVLT